MRIYITGAQGTGKTTLMNAIKEKFPNLEICRSVARELVETGQIPQEQTSQGATPKIQYKIFNTSLKKFKENDNFISDRFLTDILAYTRFMYHHEDTQESLEELHREKTDSDILIYDQSLKDYDDPKDNIIFFLPVEFELENDGLRDTNPEYQKEISNNIKYFLKNLDVRYVELKGTVGERLSKAIKIIQELKKSY